MRATDLGHGRGWADAGAAASIRRVDRHLGHATQITEAGRDWATQNAHWQRYLRYLAGGPWAPIALSPDAPSIHQLGNAVDSDEWQRHIALLAEHGWRRTVYRKINGVWKLVEPWHFEYFPDRDKHRTSPAGGQEDEDDMNADQDRKLDQIYQAIFKGGTSMHDDGRSISDSLSRIWTAVKPIRRGGTLVSMRQEIADTKTKVYALEAALSALAAATGADPAQIAGIVETAVKDAMRTVSVSIDVE